MNSDINKGRPTAIISYLTLLGTLIAIFMNLEPKNSFARFHIRQAFGLHILFYAFGLLIPYADNWFASFGFYIFVLVLWLYGFWGAINGIKRLIPIFGESFQKWFKFIS